MTTAKAKSKIKQDQEEQVAHLIVQMQNYFEGLQAANRLPCAPAKISEKVEGLHAAYEARSLKTAGFNFSSISACEITDSLDISLTVARKRISDLIDHGWPSTHLIDPKSY